MIDRDQFNFKIQLKRGLDQPATGPPCAAEKVCAIDFQEKPPVSQLVPFNGVVVPSPALKVQWKR